MVWCFVPCCHHSSSKDDCKFYRFPADDLKRRRWSRVVGRYKREPTNISRICSCHFPEGKERGPVLFINKDGDICPDHKVPCSVQKRAQTAQVSGSHPESTTLSQPRKQPTIPTNHPQAAVMTADGGLHSQSFTDSDHCPAELVILPAESVILDHSYPDISVVATELVLPAQTVNVSSSLAAPTPLRSTHVATQTDLPNFQRMQNILLQVQLRELREEMKALTEELSSFKTKYTPSRLSDKVLKMETALPDRECFYKIVECAIALESSDRFNYRFGWKVKSVSVEEQVFLTLMKMRHNYKDFHLGALFSTGEGTIRNITQTWTEILKGLLDDCTPSPMGCESTEDKKACESRVIIK